MKHWTTRRKVSLIFHTAAFAVPFAINLIASVTFWSLHSGNILFGVVAVFVVEIIALAAFIAELCGVRTQFSFLKNVLPVLGAVGLTELLFRQFSQHNTNEVAAALVAVASFVIVGWLFASMRGVELAVLGEEEISAEELLIDRLTEMRERQTYTLLDQVASQAEQYIDATSPHVLELPVPVTENHRPIGFHRSLVTNYGEDGNKNVTSSGEVTNDGNNDVTFCDEVTSFVKEQYKSGVAPSFIVKMITGYTPRRYKDFKKKVDEIISGL